MMVFIMSSYKFFLSYLIYKELATIINDKNCIKEVVFIILDLIRSQIKNRENRDIILFKIPNEVTYKDQIISVKWRHKVYLFRKLFSLMKLNARLFSFEDGIRDEYHMEPYYIYSYIKPTYDFDYDRHGVYRAEMFGLIMPKSKFYSWECCGNIKKVDVDRYL